MMQYYAGQEIQITITFVDVNNALADPSYGTVSYRDAGLVTFTKNVDLTALTKVSTGIFTLLIDTTGFVADIWNVQVFTGGVLPVVDVAQFEILARPLG